MSAEMMARLDRIEAGIAELRELMRNAAPRGATGAPRPVSTGGAHPVADARDLDSQWGDPEVRYDPKRWRGDSYKGRRYSECPADYLLELAGFLDWMAGKDEEEGGEDKLKYAGYKRKDAARARGWAARVASAPPRKLNDLFGSPPSDADDDIDFGGPADAGDVPPGSGMDDDSFPF